MNSYLKEIADFCGIKKLLTMHTARYTFATTITLANNVKLENVLKMLGHTNTRMTLHYAHIMNKSLAQEMNKVAAIMGGIICTDEIWHFEGVVLPLKILNLNAYDRTGVYERRP